MRLRHVFFVLAVVSLSGCFLKQDPPATTQNGTFSPVDGLIALEDISGDQAGAALQVEFAHLGRSAFLPRYSPDGVAVEGFGHEKLMPTKSPMCKLMQGSRDQRTITFVSAGDVAFGADQQTTLYTVNEKSDHSYFMSLAAGVPSGSYQVQIGGSKDVPKFGISMMLPENLAEVTFNSATLDERTLALKISKALNVSWKAPVLINDATLMVVDIYATTANAAFDLHCATPETSQLVDKAGAKEWIIPADYMGQLPVTNTAQVFLSRANIWGGTKDTLSVQVQALRTNFVKASLE